jgi:hypothetical protein
MKLESFSNKKMLSKRHPNNSQKEKNSLSIGFYDMFNSQDKHEEVFGPSIPKSKKIQQEN